MKKIKKRKYGIWLSNHTDRRYDEWLFVRASSSEEAKDVAKDKIDFNRFSIRGPYPIKEFRAIYGNLPWKDKSLYENI